MKSHLTNNSKKLKLTVEKKKIIYINKIDRITELSTLTDKTISETFYLTSNGYCSVV